MQRQNLRVMLASEYPESRYFLKEVVEREAGGVVVGQAENVVRALNLARKLRPDLVIVDCYLPHNIGRDSLPLSRTGGLDAALTIFEEIPDTRILLLNNLEKGQLNNYVETDVTTTFSRETDETSIPFTLRDLYRRTVPLYGITYTNIMVKPREILPGSNTLSDKLIFFGSIGLLAGLGFIITIFALPVGVVLVAASGLSLFSGIVSKLLFERHSRDA